MTFEQMAALIKADFTADQIKTVAGLFDQTPAPVPENPTPSPTPTPTPTPTPEIPATPATGDTNPPAAAPQENETQKMLREMLGIMQKGMVQSVGAPQAPAQPSAEDILIAAVLNPAKD